jgi:sulfite dehydrogenase (cytochrome) subunit B
MKRRSLPLATLAAAALWTAFAGDKNDASTTWTLPAEVATLAPGAGLESVRANCALCHSSDYITTQPRLTRAQWTAEVEKMRGKYGAPVPTNAVPELVTYLVTAYGNEAKVADKSR